MEILIGKVLPRCEGTQNDIESCTNSGEEEHVPDMGGLEGVRLAIGVIPDFSVVNLEAPVQNERQDHHFYDQVNEVYDHE